ncbi:hypothetical protein CEXT_221341 [Caerostris extrusa]|uniref:Uncharacterized protein n=1 Tax=Caerostris extrusa TaxID=172846 RepID=A0AAV4U8Y9_CAEEX|nr:hypothetical protein CEXT_221341 [Caerostris extrusa]
MNSLDVLADKNTALILKWALVKLENCSSSFESKILRYLKNSLSHRITTGRRFMKRHASQYHFPNKSCKGLFFLLTGPLTGRQNSARRFEISQMFAHNEDCRKRAAGAIQFHTQTHLSFGS